MMLMNMRMAIKDDDGNDDDDDDDDDAADADDDDGDDAGRLIATLHQMEKLAGRKC